jgi:hypothetical protein
MIMSLGSVTLATLDLEIMFRRMDGIFDGFFLGPSLTFVDGDCVAHRSSSLALFALFGFEYIDFRWPS